MKIVFVIEYFLPFNKGGSEWSTYYLAKDLVKKGHKVTIITPNYGSQKLEVIDGIKIVRTPFYKKVKNFKTLPGNFFYTNPLFIAWNTIAYYIYIRKEQAQIINIHGKYSVPPVRLANIFLRLPLTATIRDYIAICNYGICLLHGNKSCSIRDYYKKDFPAYYDQYVLNKNTLNYFKNIVFSLWGRFSTKMLKYSLVGIKIVVLSKTQEAIFNVNGLKNTEQIYNSFEFPKQLRSSIKKNIIVYAGRLTPGKGVNLLSEVAPEFIKALPSYQFIFAGEGFLKNKLTKIAKSRKNLKILGNIEHKELLKLFSKAKIVVAPSNWPEPFGRVVLESIASGTPVIVGRRTGLANLIDDKWGLAVDADKESILNAIYKILKGNSFSSQIKNDYSQISKIFSESVTDKYVNLYNRLNK